jgi:hypothetical protein
LALEAAFAGAGDVAVGEPIVFSRTRLRLDGPGVSTIQTNLFSVAGKLLP